MSRANEVWLGYFKLVEEIGEVLQVLGKLGPCPDGKHFSGADLKEQLWEELADLKAALNYFIDENHPGIPDRDEALKHRAMKKYNQFQRWALTGINPEPDR